MENTIFSTREIPPQWFKKPNRNPPNKDGTRKRKFPTSFTDAEEILGTNFINPDKIKSVFNYERKQLTKLHWEMPSLKMLQRLEDQDLILIPDPPAEMTTHRICSRFRNIFEGKIPYHLSSSEFKNLSRIHTGWIILSKNPLRNSQGKNFWQQSSLVNGDKYIPELGKLIWALNLYWLVNDYKLFNNKSIRTSTVNKYGERVIISGQAIEKKFTDSSTDNDLIVVVGTRY